MLHLFPAMGLTAGVSWMIVGSASGMIVGSAITNDLRKPSDHNLQNLHKVHISASRQSGLASSNLFDERQGCRHATIVSYLEGVAITSLIFLNNKISFSALLLTAAVLLNSTLCNILSIDAQAPVTP